MFSRKSDTFGRRDNGESWREGPRTIPSDCSPRSARDDWRPPPAAEGEAQSAKCFRSARSVTQLALLPAWGVGPLRLDGSQGHQPGSRRNRPAGVLGAPSGRPPPRVSPRWSDVHHRTVGPLLVGFVIKPSTNRPRASTGVVQTLPMSLRPSDVRPRQQRKEPPRPPDSSSNCNLTLRNECEAADS